MLPNVLGHKNMYINKNKVFSGLTVNDAKIAIYNTSLKSHGEVMWSPPQRAQWVQLKVS